MNRWPYQERKLPKVPSQVARQARHRCYLDPQIRAAEDCTRFTCRVRLLPAATGEWLDGVEFFSPEKSWWGHHQYQHRQTSPFTQRTSPTAPVTPDDATEPVAPVSMMEGIFLIFYLFLIESIFIFSRPCMVLSVIRSLLLFVWLDSESVCGCLGLDLILVNLCISYKYHPPSLGFGGGWILKKIIEHWILSLSSSHHP